MKQTTETKSDRIRISINDLQKMKNANETIPMVTAYDYTSAVILQRVNVPIILVGDSLGQVVMGFDSTIPVTMEDMIRHTQMVVRGTTRSHVVADLPFMSYQVNSDEALRNAGRLIKEGGCQSVKLEGGGPSVEISRRIINAGIPVMGHLGLTPQSVNQLGGYRVQGRTVKCAETLIENARSLEEAGIYALVLELIPRELAKIITESLSIPTIGIGSGPECGGQVQVLHDLLGLYEDFSPKHARRYANLSNIIEESVSHYISDVQSGSFPARKESFTMDPNILSQILSRPL